MSWCDKLASTPTAGFRLNPHFAPGSTILAAMAPILDPMADERTAQFTINTPDQFAITISGNDGFIYNFNPFGIGVLFQHRMKTQHVSAGPPIMKMLSQPAPYTSLLSEAYERLIEAVMLTPGAKDRTTNQFGIVSSTIVSQDELPPGISLFLEYLTKPWHAPSLNFNISITTKISESDDWTDQCIHGFAKADGEEDLIVLNFDWQRVYKKPRSLSRPTLIEIAKRCEPAAIEYFETLGEGSRFDERIINSAK